MPGLAKPPFKSDLGQRIFDSISQQAWEMWMQQSVIIINHYGLSLGDPRANEFLMEQMEEFFFGVGAQMPEGWTPEGTAPAKGGAPSKGAPSK
jgi:Fe-S cluster biosynthesis and repair protein YggX